MLVRLFIFLACAGCSPTSNRLATFSADAGATAVGGQLLVYADFPIGDDNPLLVELVGQREAISQSLAVTIEPRPIRIFLFATRDRYLAHQRQHLAGWPQRRACFVETDGDLAVYAHAGDNVAQDLRHEVAHGYLHAAVAGLPLWLDEGLAEYFELPPEAGGFHRQHLALLADRLHGGWQPDLSRLEQLTEAGQMRQLDYAEAWAWVYLLLKTEPQRKRMLQDYLQSLSRGQAASLAAFWRSGGSVPENPVAEILAVNRPGEPPRESR